MDDTWLRFNNFVSRRLDVGHQHTTALQQGHAWSEYKTVCPASKWVSSDRPLAVSLAWFSCISLSCVCRIPEWRGNSKLQSAINAARCTGLWQLLKLYSDLSILPRAVGYLDRSFSYIRTMLSPMNEWGAKGEPSQTRLRLKKWHRRRYLTTMQAGMSLEAGSSAGMRYTSPHCELSPLFSINRLVILVLPGDLGPFSQSEKLAETFWTLSVDWDTNKPFCICFL